MKVKVKIQQIITTEVEIEVEAQTISEAHSEVGELNLGEYIEDGVEVGNEINLYSVN